MRGVGSLKTNSDHSYFRKKTKYFEKRYRKKPSFSRSYFAVECQSQGLTIIILLHFSSVFRWIMVILSGIVSFGTFNILSEKS